MRYYVFNIGQPYTDEWWWQNLQHNVITAGFDGLPSDRGEVILNQLAEHDWVIAFANGYGYIGAGLVGPSSTYHLLPETEVPAGWLSHHRHTRQIKWAYAVSNLIQGISVTEVDHHVPRQTKERIPEHKGNRVIGLLSSRSVNLLTNQSLSSIEEKFSAQVNKSRNASREARLNRLAQAGKRPIKVPVISFQFIRNPDVVAETLYLAGNICQRCKSSAPFIRRSDKTPYLEVHHKVPLAQDGEDTVENAIALCPNCHRYLHHGQA